MWYYIIVEGQKTNKNLKEVVIMIIAVLVLFSLIGLGLWFTEETKIGKKLADKMYDYFMGN